MLKYDCDFINGVNVDKVGGVDGMSYINGTSENWEVGKVGEMGKISKISKINKISKKNKVSKVCKIGMIKMSVINRVKNISGSAIALMFCIVFCLVFFLDLNSGFCDESVDALLNDLKKRSDSLNQDKMIKNQPEDRFVNTAKLQGLNKITGKTFEIETGINNSIDFERLEIIPLKCWKSYPEESPENKLLIKIFETNVKNDDKKLIFYGWIFSSSPSISGLEHPLYDIRLEDCYNKTKELK